MLNEDSIQYAIENTQIVVMPQNLIQTFGTTVFRFHLVTELMDSVEQIRIRDGLLHAERPSIITPAHYHRMLDEGFGEKAAEFVEWLRENAADFAVLRYGFQFRKVDVKERVVRQPVEDVLRGLRELVDRADQQRWRGRVHDLVDHDDRQRPPVCFASCITTAYLENVGICRH